MCKKSFSLIELLVVVAIIGVLASLILPSLGAARKRAQSAVCQNNIKQIGLAISMYALDNDNYAPADNKSTATGLQWHRTLSQSNYINYDHEDDGTAFVCPNGEKLDNNWESNYGLNFRLGRGNASGGSDSSSTNYQYLSKLNSNHAQETMVLMDGFNKFRFVQSIDMNTTRLLQNSPSIARHQEKANLLFVDGHIESQSYSTLLTETSYLEDFWTP